MDMFAKRELEMTRDIAIDRGHTFQSFPWWRGAKTSCSIHPPGGTQYPGDELSPMLVVSALKNDDRRQYRSILQPHDVTHCKWHVLGPVVDFTWLKIRPSSESTRLRRVSVKLPQVDRTSTAPTASTAFNATADVVSDTADMTSSMHSGSVSFLLPMRSLRWLDRANILTLLGGSLENAWRRSKDLHRRQYLSWLQTLGLVLPDVDQNGSSSVNSKRHVVDNNIIPIAPETAQEESSFHPVAMFTEFPTTSSTTSSYEMKDGGGGSQSLKQHMPEMLSHARQVVVKSSMVSNESVADRVLQLEDEVATLKKELEMERKKSVLL